MSLLLSVVVCTYNREELLGLCLRSLVEQTLEKGRYEVIVVENNSTAEACRIARTFAESEPNFRVVSEEKQGLSHARNRGWREAQGEYVAFIDDDAKATPTWCERIVLAFAAADPQPAAVGGKILPFYEASPPAWFSDDFEIRSWGETPGLLQDAAAKFGFSGSNMAFPKAILEEFGGFSPDLGMKGEKTAMGEETQLFSNIYRKVPRFFYDPQMLVYHWTPRRNMTVSYRLYRNFKAGESLALMQKRPPHAGNYLLALWAVLDFLATTPFALLTCQRPLRSEAVRRGEELAGRVGYYLGRSSAAAS